MNTNSQKDYPITPIPFTQVRLTDEFWQPRMETNRTVTVPYNLQKCEETGRIDNFAIAAGLMEGKFTGIRFNDSDIFKVIEGAAYTLHTHPDPELDVYLDAIIAKIAAAQEEDGYLFTTRTIAERLGPENLASDAGKTRWSYLKSSHELYNVGHMYEAAVAHYTATGKRNFLDVALKNADLIAATFGPDKLRDVPGHEEIEIGLVKLYRVTGQQKYLDLAKFFVEERGHANGRELGGEYTQDHKPVAEQDEAIGHAVRAGYLYAGIADVAALTGDQALITAIDRIWENVVTKKLYLTGGIGARHQGEAFGDAYELPNATAYNETCAAIANIFWNHRLFLLHGDAKYIDILERTLYNGFLAGIAFNGKEFFYPNPLESDGVYTFNHGTATRQPWFHCSCCPPNVERLIAALPGYVYAQRQDEIYVNLFTSNESTFTIAGSNVSITQATRYPWEGTLKLTITPDAPTAFTLKIRIPGWAQGQPVPGNLYRYVNAETPGIMLTLNGTPVPPEVTQGFATLHRVWQAGDVVTLVLPMPARRVISHPQVTENVGKVALERGPLVYCAEWPDNDRSPFNIVLSDDVLLTTDHRLLGPISDRTTNSITIIQTPPPSTTFIPYYAWSHRGVGEMVVWVKRG
ncbi:MAG: glycoside hydrolase family 127 protein [Anaerolineae bacterium]|nr:glycoside hydrolase family 127 protein [Anaerolineae bacterium]